MLKGKNVILTGANGGIGRAILRLFAQNHANIWCLGIGMTEEFCEETDRLAEENNVFIRRINADFSDSDNIKGAFSEIVSDKTPIDILINNAGINHRERFLMTSLPDMNRIFQINFFAPLQLIQLTSKRMIRNNGGVIINIGSVSGFEHNIGNFTYAASKNSLMWATQTLSRELAPYHIRVNGIAPGLIDTPINDGNEKIINETVLPRMNIQRRGTPEEIAQAVLFLTSESSSFISGQILRVDGGRF